MKRYIALCAVLLGTVASSQAGGIHLYLPLPPLPRVYIEHPRVEPYYYPYPRGYGYAYATPGPRYYGGYNRYDRYYDRYDRRYDRRYYRH